MSPDLFCVQTEFSVYVLLRLWVFLQLHPAWDGEPQEAVLQSHNYFQGRHTAGDQVIVLIVLMTMIAWISLRTIITLTILVALTALTILVILAQERSYFLEQEDSSGYLPVFRNIRLPHLINHHMDVAMLVSDRWSALVYCCSGVESYS